jgi:two-component system cell cycle sensor histidine kinase/response regulator CckA
MTSRLLWFLPRHLRSAPRDDQRRALLVVGGSLLTATFGLLIAVLQLLWGLPLAATASASGAALGAALPFLVRLTGRWRMAAAILTGAVWIPALAVAVLTNGAMAAAVYYLVLGAAIAALTVGPRVGLALGVANAVIVGAIFSLRVAHVGPLVAVDPEIAQDSAMRGAFLFNLALAALIAAYELLRTAAIRDSEANERRYHALADHGPDLIAEIDPQGRVVPAGAGSDGFAAALAGVRLGDARSEGIHVDDRPMVTEAFRLLERQPSARIGPLRWLREGGATEWIEASLTRYHAATESRTLVVARDVSERIALESQLRQSHKMQAVGQLASGLSHDFNNLLMVISGYSELLAIRAAADPAVRETTSEIRKATQQGATLTRRLLGLATTNPDASAPQVLDVSDAVRECDKLLRVLLGEGIALTMQTTAEQLPVRADAGELEQVLVNLAANARDALGPSGLVRITTRRTGERAAIEVWDSGPGIPAAVAERIFEPFFTTKAPGAGSGLGLYVVYSVVKRLGGEVVVDSAPGQGARFTIFLPLVAATAAPGQDAAKDVVAGGTERILVVEDRSELRFLLRRWLETAGYDVTVAADGVEGLALQATARVDLVVSDIVMPRMGGPQLVAELRRTRPDLRALFVSGGPPGPGELAPGDRVLRKPFAVRDLHRAVREALAAS